MAGYRDDPLVQLRDKYLPDEDTKRMQRTREALEMGKAAYENSPKANPVLDTPKAQRAAADKAMENAKEAQNEYMRETTRGIQAKKKGGFVSSASKRADGCAQRGKTKGKMR